MQVQINEPKVIVHESIEDDSVYTASYNILYFNNTIG